MKSLSRYVHIFSGLPLYFFKKSGISCAINFDKLNCELSEFHGKISEPNLHLVLLKALALDPSHQDSHSTITSKQY